MPRNLPKWKILQSCMEGVDEASKTYAKWSGGQTVWSAPESFLQVYVAQQLAAEIPFVTLEEKVRDVVRDSGAEMRGKLPRAKSGRIDIVLWHKSGKPRVVVEVKLLSSRGGITRDVQRIKNLVRRCPSIQAGIVLAATQEKKSTTIFNRLTHTAKVSKSRIARRSIPQTGTNKRGEKVYFGAACFFVSQPR
jgi:Holliday junction resolvase-like predicted endonuclease